MWTRRSFVSSFALMGTFTSVGMSISTAGADAHAGKIDTLHIIAPGSAGGGYDGHARSLEAALKAEGLIDAAQIANVPGAGGTLGLIQFVERFEGRGDALLISASTMVSAIIANKTPVDLRATTPIARTHGTFNAIVVSVDSPFTSIGDLLSAFQSDPSSIAWAGGSVGGGDHMVVGMLTEAAAVDPKRLNYVAFTGGGEITAAVLGGHVTAAVSSWSEISEQVRANKLRCLGVTSDQDYPGIGAPTLKSQGVDVVFYGWGAVLAARDISGEDRANLSEIVDTAVKSQSWQTELGKRGWYDLYLPGEDFVRFVDAESERFRSILAKLGLA